MRWYCKICGKIDDESGGRISASDWKFTCGRCIKNNK